VFLFIKVEHSNRDLLFLEVLKKNCTKLGLGEKGEHSRMDGKRMNESIDE
jgi:hypothetical protein